MAEPTMRETITKYVSKPPLVADVTDEHLAEFRAVDLSEEVAAKQAIRAIVLRLYEVTLVPPALHRIWKTVMEDAAPP